MLPRLVLTFLHDTGARCVVTFEHSRGAGISISFELRDQRGLSRQQAEDMLVSWAIWGDRMSAIPETPPPLPSGWR